MSSQEVNTHMKQPIPKFGVGEKVLCYRGPFLFEAKCKKVKFNDDQNTHIYYVHYWGWNRYWDEWLPENKILQLNDANIRLQRELESKHRDQDHQGSRNTTNKRRSNRHEKLKNDVGEGTSGVITTASSNRSEVEKKYKIVGERIPMPIQFDIGGVLLDNIADDWVKINLTNKLVRLPSLFSVDHIIDAYLMERSKTHTLFEVELFRESALGVKHYFNLMLETHVLYKREFPQLEHLFYGCIDYNWASRIYGGIHLVRLFPRLGWILSYDEWENPNVKVITTYIGDFIQFISTEAGRIFHEDNYFDVAG